MTEDTPAPSNRYLVVESPEGTRDDVFHVYGFMRTPRSERGGPVAVPEWGWGPVVFPLMVDGMGTMFAYAQENRFGVAANYGRYSKPDVGTVFEWEFVTRESDSWSEPNLKTTDREAWLKLPTFDEMFSAAEARMDRSLSHPFYDDEDPGA